MREENTAEQAGQGTEQLPLLKWQQTIDLMCKLLQVPTGLIMHKESGGYRVVIANHDDRNPYSPGALFPENINGFCRRVIRENKPLYVRDAHIDPGWQDNPSVTEDHFSSYLGFPIRQSGGDIFGTVCIMDFNATNYSKEYVDMVEEFSNILQMDLQLIQQFLALKELSVKDELTGLYNRRGFFTLAEQQLNLAHRYGLRLGLMFIDMDNLKTVNDQYGHSAGDRALQKIAQVIQGELSRQSDIVARLGGDEFVCLCTIQDEQELDDVAQRITQHVSEYVQDDEGHDLSVCVGKLVVPENTDMKLEQLVKLADQQMYQLKKNRH